MDSHAACVLFIYLKIFIYLFTLAVPGLCCSTWDLRSSMRDLWLQHAGSFLVAACLRDLAPQPGVEPGPPALGAWSLTHWTTREVPACVLDKDGYNLAKTEEHKFLSSDRLEPNYDSTACCSVLYFFVLNTS